MAGVVKMSRIYLEDHTWSMGNLYVISFTLSAYTKNTWCQNHVSFVVFVLEDNESFLKHSILRLDGSGPATRIGLDCILCILSLIHWMSFAFQFVCWNFFPFTHVECLECILNFVFDFTAWFQQQVPFTKLLSFRTSLRAHFVNPLWVPPAARHPPRWVPMITRKGFVKCMLKWSILDGNSICTKIGVFLFH